MQTESQLFVLGKPRWVAHVIRTLQRVGEQRPGEDGVFDQLPVGADVYYVVTDEPSFLEARHLQDQVRVGLTVIIDASGESKDEHGKYHNELAKFSAEQRPAHPSISAFDQAVLFPQNKAA